MSITLNYSDMTNVATGACILASGGGGSYQASLKMLGQGIRKDGTVTVMSLSEVPRSGDQWLCVCATMGSPDAFYKNYQGYAAANAIQALGAQTGRNLQYVLPVEVGAINSVAPLTAAYQRNVPVIDADGAGRSIPTLPLDVYAAYAAQPYPPYNIYPNMLATNDQGSFRSVGVNTSGPAPEMDAETYFLNIALSSWFGGNTSPLEYGAFGLAMYVMNTYQLYYYPPVSGTLTLALALGRTYSQMSQGGTARAQQIVYQIQSYSRRPCRILMLGQVTNMTQAVGGTDIGTITVTSGNDTLLITNENENIFAQLNGQYYVVGPDSIGYIPYYNVAVFDNDDLWQLYKAGQRPWIFVIATQADDVVNDNTILMDNWMKELQNQGYAGPPLPYRPWLQAEAIGLDTQLSPPVG